MALVRTKKECDPARGTHFLERSEVRTGYDMERKLAHLHPREGTGQDTERM